MRSYHAEWPVFHAVDHLGPDYESELNDRCP